MLISSPLFLFLTFLCQMQWGQVFGKPPAISAKPVNSKIITGTIICRKPNLIVADKVTDESLFNLCTHFVVKLETELEFWINSVWGAMNKLKTKSSLKLRGDQYIIVSYHADKAMTKRSKDLEDIINSHGSKKNFAGVLLRRNSFEEKKFKDIIEAFSTRLKVFGKDLYVEDNELEHSEVKRLVGKVFVTVDITDCRSTIERAKCLLKNTEEAMGKVIKNYNPNEMRVYLNSVAVELNGKGELGCDKVFPKGETVDKKKQKGILTLKAIGFEMNEWLSCLKAIAGVRA